MTKYSGVSKTEKREFLFLMCVRTQDIHRSEHFLFEQRWFLCLYLAYRYRNLNEVATSIHFFLWTAKCICVHRFS